MKKLIVKQTQGMGKYIVYGKSTYTDLPKDKTDDELIELVNNADVPTKCIMCKCYIYSYQKKTNTFECVECGENYQVLED